MEEPEEDTPFSLYAFVEKTARFLRSAAKQGKKKARDYTRETSLSPTNRISQIALLLRSEAKKKKLSRRKKD